MAWVTISYKKDFIEKLLMNRLLKSAFFVLAFLMNTAIVFGMDAKPEEFQINQKPSHFFLVGFIPTLKLIGIQNI